MSRRAPFFIFFLLFASELAAKEINVIFGISRPPFVMEQDHTGIVIELFKHIAKKLDLKYKHYHASNFRMDAFKEQNNIDVIVEVQKTDHKVFYSDPFIVYRNYVVTRKTDNIDFKFYSDLRDKRVCAWQNARDNLGKDFSSQIKFFSDYQEYPKQENQVKSWLAKQCQAIIIDDTLLKWWIKKLEPNIKAIGKTIDKNLVYAPLPGQNHLWWYVAFKDQHLRDRFNKVLNEIKKDGSYDKIRTNFINNAQ